MRVTLNPKQADHAPLIEWEGGAVIPSYEAPGRFDAIRAALETAGGFEFEEAPKPTEEPVALVHHAAYVAYLPRSQRGREAGARPGHGSNSGPPCFRSVRTPAPTVIRYHYAGQFCFDTYTPILPGTFAAAARWRTTPAARAADLIADGTERLVYALTRPPGHHAEPDRCGGYCYFNNAAVAAERLSKLGTVAVLDLDVHHAATAHWQHIFYSRADVCTVSVHGDPVGLYPFFSGFADETGTGAGLGCNVNVPLPPGLGVKEYRPALAAALEAVRRFNPTFLVFAFGADTHETEPDRRIQTADEVFAYRPEMGAAVREAEPADGRYARRRVQPRDDWRVRRGGAEGG